MEKKGNLLSVREDVRVLDATIRDGGLVNNFRFTDEFIRKLYETNIAAGVDYMEFGYKADKDIFDESKFGKWKFAKDEDIWEIIGEKNPAIKLSVMADVGRCNFRRDIKPRSESPIDMIRVATYINTMPAAIEMVEYAKEMGYEATCNIMAISKAQESDVAQGLQMLASSNVDAVYIVDSYGNLYPEQIARITKFYQDILSPAGKSLGIHAHNNQQMAFANTIESLSIGSSFLDATYSGMGRGAGNCAMELLLGFLKNPKYKLMPVLKFIEKYMLEVKKSGAVWGYDIPYMLTGQLNQHPSAAIEYIAQEQTAYGDFYQMLLDREV
jgi:4-hydroxy 2-oxovalerate aldolase